MCTIQFHEIFQFVLVQKHKIIQPKNNRIKFFVYLIDQLTHHHNLAYIL